MINRAATIQAIRLMTKDEIKNALIHNQEKGHRLAEANDTDGVLECVEYAKLIKKELFRRIQAKR